MQNSFQAISILHKGLLILKIFKQKQIKPLKIKQRAINTFKSSLQNKNYFKNQTIVNPSISCLACAKIEEYLIL